MTGMDRMQSEFTRRAFLGGSAALGTALSFAPGLAFAAQSSWPGVTAFAERYVDSGKLVQAVAAMGVGQGAPDVIARGQRTLDGGRLDGDSLFRLYSMTKPVTGMAAMILIDEGKLHLDHPLAEILPKFAKMQVQRVYDGPITADNLEPARQPITIRHLLTHTSGLAYSFVQQGPIKTAMVERGLVPGRISRLPIAELFGARKSWLTLEQFADGLAEMPLVYQPGTMWSYSTGLDLMGRVIEVVSGQPFDRFLQERLFDPLGMTSTFFRVPKNEAYRLTTNFGILEGVLLPLDPASRSVFFDQPAFPFGGSGLVSSPRDYDRFLRMLVGLGTLDGTRVMSEAAVRLGTSNLLPKEVDTRASLLNGAGFGAGARVGIGAETGTFGWGGAAGTIAFADLRRGWRGGFYTQYMPYTAYSVQEDFPKVAMKDALSLLSSGAGVS